VETLPLNEGMDSLTAAAGLEERVSLQKAAEYKALYTDLDYNSHVNNVSYIRWIEDSVDLALLEKAKQMRLDINYMNEVLPGEITGIWSAPVEMAASPRPSHAFAFEGRKLPDNQPAFRAELQLWE